MTPPRQVEGESRWGGDWRDLTPESDPGVRQLHCFADVLGDDHLELGREGERGHSIHLNIVVRMVYR